MIFMIFMKIKKINISMIYNFKEYSINERLGVNQVVQSVTDYIWGKIKNKKIYFKKEFDTKELPSPFNQLDKLTVKYSKYGKTGNQCYFNDDINDLHIVINLKILDKSFLAHELNHAHEFILFFNSDIETSDDDFGIFDFSNLKGTYKLSLNYYVYIYSNSEMNSRIIETYNDLSEKSIKTKKEFISHLNSSYNYNFYKKSFNFYMKIFHNILTDKGYRMDYMEKIQLNDTFKIDEKTFIREIKQMMKSLIIKNRKIIRKFHKLYDMVISL